MDLMRANYQADTIDADGDGDLDLVHHLEAWDKDEGVSGAFDRLSVPSRTLLQAADTGVCPEYLVAIANELDADLHITVPHRCGPTAGLFSNGPDVPTYRQAYLKDYLFHRILHGSPAVSDINGGQPFLGLEAGRTLWIELSNEVWNFAFPQATWIDAQSDEPYGEVYGQEAFHVFQAANEKFAGAEFSVGRYIGANKISFSFGRQALRGILDEAKANNGGVPIHYRIDGFGPSFYWGPHKDHTEAYCAGPVPPYTQIITDGLTMIRDGLPNHQCGSPPQPCPVPPIKTMWINHRMALDDYKDGNYEGRGVGQPPNQRMLLYFYEGMNNFVPSGCPNPPPNYHTPFRQAQTSTELWQAWRQGYAGFESVLASLEASSVNADVLLFYRFMEPQTVIQNSAGNWAAWDNMGETGLSASNPFSCQGGNPIDSCRPKVALLKQGP